MPFVKGQSGNMNGRPTKERIEEKELKAGELDAVIRRLRRASPKALNILMQGMEDESIPMKDRMKYAKDIYDLYLKTLGVDVNIKRGKNASVSEEEEEKPALPAVVFKLHKTS
jgi:hypothetical protein